LVDFKSSDTARISTAEAGEKSGRKDTKGLSANGEFFFRSHSHFTFLFPAVPRKKGIFEGI
jgi:hypothetical protein